MKLTQVRHYLANPQVPRWRKLLGLLALAYVVLPMDAVPDVVPLFGWLDDVGVVAAVATFLVRDIKRRGVPTASPGKEVPRLPDEG
ncbi:MAG: DUF1232 domain-containing protein [Myxococcota bacterium]